MSVPKYLTMDQMLSVLARAKESSPRDHCLVLFAFRFGLRCSEVSLLRLEDVKDGYLDVQRLKGSLRTRDEIVSDTNPLLDCQKALKTWLRVRPDTGSQFLFISRLGSGLKRKAVYNIFEDCAFRAGLPVGMRNIHLTKHTLGVNLRLAGTDLATIAQALGHRDPSTTIKFYSHVSRDEVKNAVSGAFQKLSAA